MRPDILNPIFAEISLFKGVGPALARPLERLDLKRAVDVAFHLPVSWVDRHLTDRLDMADAGRIIGTVLTPIDYRAGGSARAVPRAGGGRAGQWRRPRLFWEE